MGAPVHAIASSEPGGRQDRDGQDIAGAPGPFLFSAPFVAGGKRIHAVWTGKPGWGGGEAIGTARRHGLYYD